MSHPHASALCALSESAKEERDLLHRGSSWPSHQRLKGHDWHCTRTIGNWIKREEDHREESPQVHLLGTHPIRVPGEAQGRQAIVPGSVDIDSPLDV